MDYNPCTLSTTPEAVLPPKLTGTLARSTVIAALGGLLFGFDTAVISGTTAALQSVYDLSGFSLGFTVASALIGTIVGSLVVGRPADVFGRRRVLFAIAVLYFVSALGSALAWSWSSFLFFRFLGGIGVGGASVVSPMYIAEISPAALRGRLVAVTQFNIVLGILLAFFSNYVVAQLGLHVGSQLRVAAPPGRVPVLRLGCPEPQRRGPARLSRFPFREFPRHRQVVHSGLGLVRDGRHRGVGQRAGGYQDQGE